MRPSNAVRTVWDAEAIDISHLGFRPIQKIATIHASSGLIRGIPTNTPRLGGLTSWSMKMGRAFEAINIAVAKTKEGIAEGG
jgi:hypothetical protein